MNASQCERFIAKVQVLTDRDCWEWQGARQFGYGVFQLGVGVAKKAHRLAWEWEHGPIPDGMCVCHHCDNPSCCNPSHLFLGTPQDNVRDRNAKGRQAKGKSLAQAVRASGIYERVPRGSQCHASKLMPEDVRDIRRLRSEGMTQQALADKYGIKRESVRDILRGRNWGWLV
jgi:hypothetical protein